MNPDPWFIIYCGKHSSLLVDKLKPPSFAEHPVDGAEDGPGSKLF